MKRLAIILILFTLLVAQSQAQPPRQPSSSPPGVPGQGSEDDQDASIGGGLVLLLALGTAYGSKKVLDNRKKPGK